MRAVLVEHGELQIALEWRSGHGLPHLESLSGNFARALI
jgi:hypothetical protein